MPPVHRRGWGRAARGWTVALLLIAALPFVRADTARAQSFAAATVAELIAAMNTANGNGQVNVITLTPGATYTLATATSGAPGDETGLPRITSNLTIIANGAVIERSSAAGTPHFRIFAVTSSGALTLNGVTIRNGSLAGVAGAAHAPDSGLPGDNGGSAAGGAITVVASGSLTVINCIFTGNSATGGTGGDGGSGANGTGNQGGSGGKGGGGGSAGGGAISTSGTAVIRGTTFVGNSATGGAGGNGGHGGNAWTAPGGKGGNAGAGASGSGGALQNTGALTAINTTFTANSAVGGSGGTGGVGGGGTGIPVNGLGANGGDGDGGAMADSGSGTLAAINATVARNNATGGALGTGGAGDGADGRGVGGGIRNGVGSVMVTNTLFAANIAGDGNCGGNSVGDGGYNLDFAPSATCNFADHAQSEDPGVGALANHGGPTPTLAIAPGGVAAGAGKSVVCAGALPNGAGGVDQRGLSRPAPCSIGAFEPQAAPFPTLAMVSPPSGGLAGGSNVTLAGSGFVTGATVTFGGVAAAPVAVGSATTITVTTPAHASGAVDVVVTNPDRQAAALSLGYTFSVVSTLPGAKPPGSPGGAPGSLPAARPPGTSSGGGPPSPLPPRR